MTRRNLYLFLISCGVGLFLCGLGLMVLQWFPGGHLDLLICGIIMGGCGGGIAISSLWALRGWRWPPR